MAKKKSAKSGQEARGQLVPWAARLEEVSASPRSWFPHHLASWSDFNWTQAKCPLHSLSLPQMTCSDSQISEVKKTGAAKYQLTCRRVVPTSPSAKTQNDMY